MRYRFSHLIVLAGCTALGMAAFLPRPLHGQTAVPDEKGNLIFKTNARTVVVDIVVTGKGGQPALGLHKEDFEISEDGRRQKISYFEEHTSQAEPTNLAALPPNVFTNVPRVTPTDSVTVLLLDSMNTQLQDQTRVHAQMLKYLKTLPPGRRIAIFALGNELRFIQGFTDDSALLAAALKNSKNGSSPISSPLLKTQGEVAADNQPVALLADAVAQTASPQAAAALAALQQSMTEQTASQNDLRVLTTFQAFQELANYLAGIPGRKNVVWFSSAFPLTLFPDPSVGDGFAAQRDYVDEVRKTDALLSAAQVAIYPVAAEGLATDALYDSQQRAGAVASGQSSASQAGLASQGATIGQQRQGEQSSSLQGDATDRNASHNAMQEIAKDTGGEAFFNTNGLSDAIARASDHGANYYTVTYTPGNNAEDGRFRKIEVKLAKKTSTNNSGGSFKLAYRRGYYANKAATVESASAKPAGDPLHPYMGPGMPSSTQIPFALRVTPEGVRPVAATTEANEKSAPAQPATQAGDNPDLVKLAGPTTRYKVSFVVAARGLRLSEAPNGRHGLIEATLVIYNTAGKPLNWLIRQINLDMSAARYVYVQENGVNFDFEIDAPKEGTSLRAGVFDDLSKLAGTLEIPLSSVQKVAVVTHATQ